MPNICTNHVEITGPAKDIKEIWEKYKTEDEGHLDELCLSFNKILPRPKDHKDLCSWSNENWGTKWDVMNCYNSEVYLEDGHMLFSYDTAWGPGDRVLLHLSKLYPEIEIELEYYEFGCMFAGKDKYKGGEIVEEFYTEDETKLREMYPEDFEDYN